MTDKEIFEQTLNALNRVMRHGSAVQDAKNILIAALEKLLAQPDQKPVAHVYLIDPNGRPRVAWDDARNIKVGDKLYKLES